MADRRRILYVDLAAGVGGSVISLYELVKGLNRERYEPQVILRATNPYVERFRELGVTVRSLGEGLAGAAPSGALVREEGEGGVVARMRRSRLARGLKQSALGERLVHFVGFYVRAYPRLRREARELAEILRAVRPDLVHLNDAVCVSRAGIMAARRVGVPAICHVRAMEERNHYDRWLSRSLKGFICISQAVARHEARSGGRVRPCWVVYNGLDLADFAWGEDKARVRAELGFTAGELVGCVGRLVAWKGQDVFLRALARLKERYPALRGLVVGEPGANGARYAQELRELARRLGLEDRVLFTGFRRDIPRLLGAMDVLVHASTAPEPFGRVIIEGMAAGTPVVGTNAGAVPEIIEDKVTGLLVPPGDAGAMAEAIAWVLEHPQEAQAMRLAARRAVELRFTTERYVQGVERVYEEILR